MKKLTCIVCPNGCNVTVDDAGSRAGDGNIRISGNLCPKGEAFAIQEATDARRSVTTTCRTTFAGIPVVPVRTDGEIRKELMQKVVAEVNRITISRAMKLGDVVMENVLETGVNIILCTNQLQGMK